MTQEFVTLPREVVKRALKAMEDAGMQRGSTGAEFNAIESLRAALEQPQNHVTDAGNMVTAGWKLVPVEPTDTMVIAAYESQGEATSQACEEVYRAMLAAAPQSPAMDQPQANQPAMTPIAQRKLDSLLTEGYTISGYSIYHEQKHQHGFVTGAGLVGWWKPEGMEHPQPRGAQDPTPNGATHIQPRQGAFYKRVDGKWYVWSLMKNGEPHRWYISPGTAESCLEPLAITPKQKRHQLTDEQIDAIADAMPGGLEGFMKGWGWRQFARAVIEATNNIK